MSQKIKTSVEIDGSLSASQIANATTDTDKFLVSDGGTIKYRTGAELATDLGISAGVTSKVQHQVKAGVAINKGQAVYVTGADGTNMIVGLASNATEATSSKTMGLLNATVSANGFADVITEGLLDGLDTSTAVVGNPVWLGTGGNLIYGLANKPYAPAHLVFIGIVTRVNANNGEIFVKVQNGFELDEIHDIDLKTTTPINGHLLGYNGTLWVNKTIAGWLGYTPQAQLNGTGFVKASGTTITYDNTSYYPASNPNGYISTYTETDTLASVTGRGALTNTPISISAGTLNHLTLAERFNLVGGSNFHITNNAYYDSGFKYKFADLATKLALQADGILSYQTAVTGTIGAAVTFDTKFSVDSSGNLTVPGTLSASGYNKTNWDTAFGWGNHAGLYLGINSKAADSELLDGIDSTRVIFGDNSTGTISISDATLNGALKSGFYTVGTGGIPNATSVNFVLHTAYNGVGNAAGFDLACNDSTTSSFYLRPATGGGKGSWQTIVTSANIGSYAVPSSRTITINGVSQDLSSNRSWTVSGTVTSGVSITSAGSANNTPSTPSVNIGMYVDTYAFIDLATANSQGSWIDFSKADGSDYGGRIRYVNVSDYFSISAGANEQVRIFSSNAEALGSFRAPLFYDSNDTSYYVNPAGASILNGLKLVSSGDQASGNDYTLWIQGSSNDWGIAVDKPSSDYSSKWNLAASHSYGLQGLKNSSEYFRVGTDLMYHDTQMRSPIFYDNNNTGYYVDPASTSNLALLSLYGHDNQLKINTYSGGASGWFAQEAGVNKWETYHYQGRYRWYNYTTAQEEAFLDNSGGYFQVRTSMRAPVFYDSNDTTYYFDGSGGTRQSRYLTISGGGSGNNGNELVVGNTSVQYSLQDTNLRPIIQATGAYPVLTLNHTVTSNGSHGATVQFTSNGVGNQFVIGSSGNGSRLDIGTASNSNWNPHNGIDNYQGTTGWRMDTSGNVHNLVSNRSPIYYDYNDTGYYFNPNTDASHRFQTPSGYIDIGPKNSGTCHIYTDRSSFYFNKDILVNGSTVLNTSNAPRAANSYVMFYEGFTLNANDMSTNSTGFTYSNNAPWTGPVARFSTGGGYDLWLNASYGSNGTGLSYRTRNGDAGSYNSWHRIYSDSYRPYADDSGTTGQRSFNYLYASSYLESGGAVYGTIFYDNNNRGYYMDPDGTSQLSSIYTNNWVRVQGDSGVYSQDYGGHLRRPVNASHGTWEIFGYNKNGYAGMNVYDPQGYNNNYMHESGNGGLYQQNGNGWIYYHSRGNACLGIMTSSTSSAYKLYVGGSIYAEGDIVAYSDRRKKENIITVNNALDTVNKLRGVYYNRIDDNSKKRQIGVIAQEIQEVLPEVVTYAEDLDEYGVSYGNITGLLIEAIKEQQTQIEELKELVNKLINK